MGADGAPSLAEACSDGDVGTVRKLLTEGRSVHETTEEGESLLSLACSAGYYELAQVLLAMHASVEDRGIKVTKCNFFLNSNTFSKMNKFLNFKLNLQNYL